MKSINNSDSAIIVLHEIYGINQHIKMVCEKFSMKDIKLFVPI